MYENHNDYTFHHRMVLPFALSVPAAGATRLAKLLLLALS